MNRMDYAAKLDAAMRTKEEGDNQARMAAALREEDDRPHRYADSGRLPLIFGIINPGLLPLCFLPDD